ncbi:YciI family protein [Arthrobacter sp. NPDC090010]|uniref:YciI family protein n=1 Tax=Arthrobacter sp. NPDC090010 TaxID=3363942 RepID=UPI0037F5F12F
MTKYLVLYRAGVSAREQMANTTPEQAKAGMDQWMAWFAKAGDAIIDGGSPVAGEDASIGGYSVLQAEDRAALDAVLEGHPHLQIGTIEVLEFLQMPGM